MSKGDCFGGVNDAFASCEGFKAGWVRTGVKTFCVLRSDCSKQKSSHSDLSRINKQFLLGFAKHK